MKSNTMVGSQMFLYSRDRLKSSNHVVIHGVSIALAAISQVCSEIFRNLAKDPNVPNALFKTSSRNVSETFALEVTMDWWSENNWIMIHFWSLAWLIHAFVNLFKRNVLGPLSCNPEIHPPIFYLMWAMINSAILCGKFLWDKHDLLGALFLTWIAPVNSFFMLYMSYCNLNKHRAWLVINNPSEAWWIRYLTQNGLALFAWWALVEAVVSFGIVLKYKVGLQDPLASTTVLTIILLCILTWFVLQSSLFIKYMRYTFTVYPILILGLGAMFTRSYRVHDMATNTVYCGFVMLLVTILSLIQLISSCFCKDKSCKSPPKEPYLTFEGCETVYQPEGKIKTNLGTDIKKVFCKI